MDNNGAPNPGSEFKPGDTITPGQPPAPAVPAEPVAPPAPVAAQPEAPTQQEQAPPPPQALAQPEAPASFAAPSPASDQSFYSPAADEQMAEPYTPAPITAQPVSWTASEFIAHHKSAGWYLVLASGAVVLAAVVWLLFKDVFSSIVVLIVAILFGAYASRTPRELQYDLDNRGITIGQKFRAYTDFRSFSITDEGSVPGIVLMPLKRFGMFLTIYFDPQDEDVILDTLSLHLPFAEHKSDPIDALMHKIRF